MKPNDPIVLVIAVALIVIAILYLNSLRTSTLQPVPGTNSSVKSSQYSLAPELSGIKGYINAEDGFRLKDVQGKVILVDFWTYSCINCIRTLPYLTAWDAKYKDMGLVIVGVHSPEFQFEKDIANVKKAVAKYGIMYPVVLDNDFATWSAYNNRYWPHKFLIDSDGYIRYDHIGEGGYEETEKMIQALLKERNDKVGNGNFSAISQVNATAVDFFRIGTPELYFGYQFFRNSIGNSQGYQPNAVVNYTLPQTLQDDLFYLEGPWRNEPDHMTLESDKGRILLRYSAKVVNIVAGKDANLSISLDGQPLTSRELGSDAISVNGSTILGTSELKLYNIVSDADYYDKALEINVSGKGFEVYTFTFG